jgi:hypothetical protein
LLEVLPHDMRRPSDQRTGLPVSAPPPIAAGDGERLEISSPFGWLSPGQVVRLPVGYILLAAAGVIILAVAVFYIGYEVGGRAERLDAEERYRRYGSPAATDPLVVDDFIDPVGAAASQGDAGDRETPTPPNTDEGARTTDVGEETAATPTPVRNDPVATDLERVRGLNYWIVTSFATPDEGERLIQFLAESGIPARAFPNPESEFVQVWVMRGFTREELRTPAAPAFQQQLRRLGRIWKNERGGADDLATMYQKKY